MCCEAIPICNWQGIRSNDELMIAKPESSLTESEERIIKGKAEPAAFAI